MFTSALLVLLWIKFENYCVSGLGYSEVLQSLSHRQIIFIGDSLTRYQYLNLVDFLYTGRWVSPFPHSESEKDIVGWNNFFTITNMRLGGYEICDCFRDDRPIEKPFRLRRVYLNFRENRHYYDPTFNISIRYFAYYPDLQIFFTDIPSSQTFISSYTPEGLQNRTRTYRQEVAPSSYTDIIGFIRDIIRPLHPDFLIFNQGYWGTMDMLAKTRYSEFVMALKEASSTPIWKRTTAKSFSHEDADDPKFITRLNESGIHIFDAYELTKACTLGEYYDEIHFQPHIYKRLNQALLHQLFTVYSSPPPICSQVIEPSTVSSLASNGHFFMHLIESIRHQNQDMSNLTFCLDQHMPLPNNYINVHFLTEPTLVLPQGVQEFWYISETPSIYNSSQMYIGQLIDRNLYKFFDVVVINHADNGLNDIRFINKVTYVPSFPPKHLHQHQHHQQQPTGKLIVVFYHLLLPNRIRTLVAEMRAQNLDVIAINASEINTVHNLTRILDDTKVLLNIHQSDYNHMFDDQFVLPALLRNVLVISEISVNEASVPYKMYVTWCKIHEMVAMTNNMINNYQTEYTKVHGLDSKKGQLLANMVTTAKTTLENVIREAVSRKIFN